MNKKLINLFVLVVMYAGPVFFTSPCEKGSETPAIVLGDDQYSGAGYARNFSAGNGDLTFTVSRKSGGTETLAVRGCGKAQADINVNGQHYEVSFSAGGSIWEIATIDVTLDSGLNTIVIRRKDAGQGGMRIDYIEIQ